MSPVRGVELLKAVLDTNLYIAAFQYPKGRNAVVWRAALAGRYRLLVSPAIIRDPRKIIHGSQPTPMIIGSSNAPWREGGPYRLQ